MASNCFRVWLVCLALTASGSALGQEETPGETLPDRRETFGAALAPATLPAGASAAYGYAGAPEVGGGYRQGLGPAEIEARGYFDYFLVALGLDLRTRLALPPIGPVEISPILGTGVVFNSGSRYIDDDNFSFWGVRVSGGVLASYRALETLRVIGELEVPIDFTVDPSGGAHVSPKAGGGVELHLAGDLSAFVMGKLGLDVLKEPLGVTQSRLGFQFRIGLGWRLF